VLCCPHIFLNIIICRTEKTLDLFLKQYMHKNKNSFLKSPKKIKKRIRNDKKSVFLAQNHSKMAKSDKFINPFTDFGFKKLFGEEANKDLLIAFLNTLLPAQHQIAVLTYKKNEQQGGTAFDRKAIYDLYCEGPNGSRFIVEMQKAKQNYFKDRSVFYATFPIQEQAVKGDEWDYKLAPVYLIGILDFIFDEDKAIKDRKVIHIVEFKDQDNMLFYDKLMLLYLAMPNFRKKVEELQSFQDKWLYILKNLQDLSEIPVQLRDGIFKKLFQVADLANLSKEERQDYITSLKYYRDMKNVTDTAFQDGETKGKIEGLAEGEIKGKMEERLKNIQKAIRRGKLSDTEIAEDYELSLEEVQEIRSTRT
jgi:predicted transposase/invertase (TIGR01784 family)